MLLHTLAVDSGAVRAGPGHSGRDGQLDVTPPRIEEEITVDGLLNEPVWAKAALLTGFSQFNPSDGVPAADSTQVLVWYSATAIHFGVRAFDQGTPRATLADRDKITADDYIQLMLGTFNDGRQALVFGVNPLGVQSDGMLVETGIADKVLGREIPDLNPDFVWQSKGRIMPWGYEVEIRIPFKSLRYQTAKLQTWRFNAVRVVQRTGFTDTWAPARRASASFLGQSGRLVGLTDMRRGVVVDINPVVTESSPGRAGQNGWGYDVQRPEVGGNVRWGITNTLTANGTANPDFSQVEADAAQVVYDPRRALFFPERRPFFLDGSEVFVTPNNLIYSRRIVQPVAAAKLTGKGFGGTSVGFMSAVDDRASSATGLNNPVYNILRLQRDVGGASRIGLAYTDRIDGDNYNRMGSLDTRIVFGKIYSINAQVAGSVTRTNGVTTTAPLWDIRIARTGRSFQSQYSFRGLSRTFEAQSGFIPRAGIVRAYTEHRFNIFGKPRAFIQSLTPAFSMDGQWQYDKFRSGGGWQDWKTRWGVDARLRGGWQVGAAALIEGFGYDSTLYSNYFIERPRPGSSALDTVPYTGTPRLPNFDVSLKVATPEFSTFSANTSVIVGKDENFFEWASANVVIINATVAWRPTDQLRADFTYIHQAYYRKTDGSRVNISQIPRLKIQYQIARPVFLRVVTQYVYNDTDSLRDDSRTNAPILLRTGAGFVRAVAERNQQLQSDVLFSVLPSPGTVFYAGYGTTLTAPDALADPRLRRSQDGFFLKASYLFRL